MSSTRHVESGERRRQNGWASATEFTALRGLNGTAVALKAALLDDPRQRELLYALQALSLREGGLKRLAREIMDMFPERLGTPTMHKLGVRPGKRLTREQCETIERELDPDYYCRRSLLDSGMPPSFSDAESMIEECRRRANLDTFIEALCCDPKLLVSAAPAALAPYSRLAIELLDDGKEPPPMPSEFKLAHVSCFQDALGALFAFVRRQAELARADYVQTSTGKVVFEAMQYVLETGKPVLIEGNSGFGKTTGLKAWHAMNPGKAIFFELTGMTTRSVFLRSLAKACGVANGDGYSAERIQSRIEEYFNRTKQILVVDEAQYLWPQGRRITTHPELINWLNTALYNKGVPFVLSATKQFTLRRQAVESQTDWSSEQLRRRTRKVFELPDKPTTQDLKSVARKLLGELGGNSAAVDLVAGYALTSKGWFQSITDAIDDARLVARLSGRDRITFKDLDAAICEWRAPSDAALQRVFDSKRESRRARQALASVGSPPEPGGADMAGTNRLRDVPGMSRSPTRDLVLASSD